MEELILQFGYLAILLGSVIEGNAFVILGGFAAHRGYLDLIPWVILMGMIGNFVGLQAGFWAGRRYGRAIVERRPQWHDRLQRVHTWLARRETLMIIGLRFIPGLTMAGYVAIGMSNVSTIRFTGFNLLGALLWAIVLGVAGYFFGHALELLLEEIKHLEAPIFLVILVVVMLKFIYRRFKR